MPDFRLYVILDLGLCRTQENIIAIAQSVLSGGAELLQLRAKNCPDRQLLKIAQNINQISRKPKARFLINDRADLVKASGALGVHLGQEDPAIEQARLILGPGKIIGRSTHSLEQAEQAQAQGADYISIGPIFATSTKPEATPIGPEVLTQVKNKIKIPFLAIGGINLNNLEQVLSAGAKRVAVCQAITTAEDVTATTQEFLRRLYTYKQKLYP